MKKLFTTLLFSVATLVSYAQESLEITASLPPNSTYEMHTKSVMDMTMNIDVVDAKIPETEKSFNSKTESEFKIRTVTSQKDKLNNVPFDIFYTDVKFKTIINGKENPSVDESLNGLYQVKIKGLDNGIKREFGEIEGPSEFKSMFEILYNSFENMNIMPKGVFKLNETHTFQNEFNVPMPDGSQFSFTMDTSFTLIKIEDGKAYFDVSLSSKPNSQQMENYTITIKNYDVKGKLKLDINDNNISESTFNGPLVINLFGEGFKMVMKTTYDYSINSKKL